MAKRYISLLLILALFPCCLAVPARADEVDDSWFNLLDYGFPQGYSSNYISLSGSGKELIVYNNPSLDFIAYYDIFFRSDATNIRIGSHSAYLTLISLGDNYYRAFGIQYSGGMNAAFNFHYDSGSYVDILSFKANVSKTNSFPINVIFGGSNGSEGIFTDKHFTNSGTIYQEFYIDSEDRAWNGGFFDCRFQFNEDWQKYDYLDVTLGYGYGEIVSVSASIDGVPLSVTVSPIYGFSEAPTWRSFNVRIDLRGVNRASTGIPVLEVNGKAIAGTNSFGIYSAYGYIDIEEPSLWTYWFTNMRNWLSSGFSSVTSSLSSLGSNISTWISNLGTNISTWISAQTSALQTSIDDLFWSFGAYFSDLSMQIQDQTKWLDNTIGSWGQSLKDSIDALPEKIAEELKGLVVPADGAIESMATKSEALVSDRFGGVFEGAQIVDNWAGQLQAQAATQVLTIPVVNMNILGSNFPIGGWEVDLIPEGFEIIFESVKVIIDILATAAFVNGIKSRLERTLEG